MRAPIGSQLLVVLAVRNCRGCYLGGQIVWFEETGRDTETRGPYGKSRMPVLKDQVRFRGTAQRLVRKREPERYNTCETESAPSDPTVHE